MNLNDLQLTAWEGAEKKGLHDVFDKNPTVGPREVVLALSNGLYAAITAVVQFVKRKGVSPENLLDLGTVIDAAAYDCDRFFLLVRKAVVQGEVPMTARHGALARLALMHTEISEAAECFDGRPLTKEVLHHFVEEIADTFIRGGDVVECVARLYPETPQLDDAVPEKVAYNDTRPMHYGTPQEVKAQ